MLGADDFIMKMTLRKSASTTKSSTPMNILQRDYVGCWIPM